MKTYAFRLTRGQDLREEIDAFVHQHGLRAGVVLTCVGNLEKAVIRMADERITKEYTGTYEIVSLVGTLERGNSHLHIAISDATGAVVGGHLKKGSLVGITAEVVLGALEGVAFLRERDEQTGFDELVVQEAAE